MSENLTTKQALVLGMLRDGKSPKQIARKLKITVNGVYGHRRKIEAKGYSTDPIEEGTTDEPTNGKVATAIATDVIEKVRANVSEQIDLVDGRLQAIEIRWKEIAAEQEKLESEGDRLNAEASMLSQTREKLEQASADPIPF